MKNASLARAPGKTTDRSLLCLPPVAGVGMGVAALLVAQHRDAGFVTSFLQAVCGAQGSGCEVVGRSPLSEVLGAPLALWGFIFYGAVFVLAIAALLEDRPRALSWVLRLAVAGAALDLALLGYSVLGLGALCKACALTYVVTAALLALSVRATRRAGLEWRKALLRGPAPGPRSASLPAVLGLGFAAVAAASGLVLMATRPRPSAATASPEEALELAWSAFLRRYQETPAVDLELATSPARGPENAVLSLTLFSDFRCGPCRRAAGTIGRFAERFEGAVRISSKHYPLDSTCNPHVKVQVHAGAGELARAAQAAQRLGRYWPLHDLLFANQDRFGTSVSQAHLALLAKQAGLDPTRFLAELASAEVEGAVRRDIELGNRLGIEGTPALFVNGRRLGSIPPEEFLERLAREEFTRRTTANGSPEPVVHLARLRRSRALFASRMDTNEGRDVK